MKKRFFSSRIQSTCLSAILVCTGCLLAGGAFARQADPEPAGTVVIPLRRLQDDAAKMPPAQALACVDRFLVALPRADRTLAWRVQPEFSVIQRCWRMGHRLYYAGSSGESFRGVDMRDGSPLPGFALGALARQFAPPERLTGLWGPEEVGLVSGSGLTPVNAVSGRVDRTLPVPCCSRVPQILLPDGMICILSPDASQAVRIDKSGQEAWRASWGDTMTTDPVLGPKSFFVQLREGATLALSLADGKILWREDGGGYGEGIALSPDGRRLVSATSDLSPALAQVVILCRDAANGRILWRRERPGSVSACPLVDPTGKWVYLLYGTGRLSCLALADGAMVWDTLLPALPGGETPNVYEPVVTPLAWRGGKLWILGRDGRLFVVDPATGQRMATVCLAPLWADDRREGKPLCFSLPELVDGCLVAVTGREVSAYPAAALLEGRETVEAQARLLRVKLLLRLGQQAEARAEVETMRTARCTAPAAWEAAAEVARAAGDRPGEIQARSRLLLVSDNQTDSRLEELVGLVRRIPLGGAPTSPLVVENRIFLGAADGLLRAFSLRDLSPLGALEVGAGVTGPPCLFDEELVVNTWARRAIGTSLDLKQIFDWPTPAGSQFFHLKGRLVRSTPYIPYAEVACLDPATGKSDPVLELPSCCSTAPVIYGERVFVPAARGGSLSFDGRERRDHAGRLEAGPYRVNLKGFQPVAFGKGGVWWVDDCLCPSAVAVERPMVFACAASRDALVALTQSRDTTDDCRLEAWRRNGNKLPLAYSVADNTLWLDKAPELRTFGAGFLYAGRELAIVDPARADPLWTFCPDGPARPHCGVFLEPVIAGVYLLAPHTSGALWVFRLDRLPFGEAAGRLAEKEGGAETHSAER